MYSGVISGVKCAILGGLVGGLGPVLSKEERAKSSDYICGKIGLGALVGIATAKIFEDAQFLYNQIPNDFAKNTFNSAKDALADKTTQITQFTVNSFNACSTAVTESLQSMLEKGQHALSDAQVGAIKLFKSFAENIEAGGKNFYEAASLNVSNGFYFIQDKTILFKDNAIHTAKEMQEAFSALPSDVQRMIIAFGIMTVTASVALVVLRKLRVLNAENEVKFAEAQMAFATERGHQKIEFLKSFPEKITIGNFKMHLKAYSDLLIEQQTSQDSPRVETLARSEVIDLKKLVLTDQLEKWLNDANVNLKDSSQASGNRIMNEQEYRKALIVVHRAKLFLDETHPVLCEVCLKIDAYLAKKDWLNDQITKAKKLKDGTIFRCKMLRLKQENLSPSQKRKIDLILRRKNNQHLETLKDLAQLSGNPILEKAEMFERLRDITTFCNGSKDVQQMTTLLNTIQKNYDRTVFMPSLSALQSECGPDEVKLRNKLIEMKNSPNRSKNEKICINEFENGLNAQFLEKLNAFQALSEVEILSEEATELFEQYLFIYDTFKLSQFDAVIENIYALRQSAVPIQYFSDLLKVVESEGLRKDLMDLVNHPDTTEEQSIALQLRIASLPSMLISELLGLSDKELMDEKNSELVSRLFHEDFFKGIAPKYHKLKNEAISLMSRINPLREKAKLFELEQKHLSFFNRENELSEVDFKNGLKEIIRNDNSSDECVTRARAKLQQIKNAALFEESMKKRIVLTKQLNTLKTDVSTLESSLNLKQKNQMEVNDTFVRPRSKSIV